MEKLNRRQARENAFILLFEASFGRDLEDILETNREENEENQIDSFGEQLLRMFYLHQEEVDLLIENKLKGWRMDRLPRVSLALLRLAITEMNYGDKDMDSVVINEIVELAKKYGDEKDYQFINGVLGTVSREKTGDDGSVLADVEPEAQPCNIDLEKPVG